eukprot:10887174-Alexandrium_andersonii.AAC.1
MSASLVGSEMCIRDRTSPESGGDCSELRQAPLRQRAHSSAVQCPVPQVACLLYTSDAADDM